ncbi:MAG: hypothetical protein C4526_08255 [Nitrospiraceae bacterium]|nr:MAG: hypothetical protein C4526_08255 [Nitrospiraceae bacterium]
MKRHSIVARFKNGSVAKGTTFDFSPFKTFFNVETESGEDVEVEIEKLKALFFVKHSSDGRNKRPGYKNMRDLGGKKIKVHFLDGETVMGYSMEYCPDFQGLFVTPVDPDGNNERIFVTTSAIDKITFL